MAFSVIEVEELACAKFPILVKCIHKALHHDNLGQRQVDLLGVGRQVTVECELDGRCMVCLKLFMLLEVELSVDLQVAVIYNLNLIYFAELNLMAKSLAALEILPDGAGYINEAEALINAVNVARVFRGCSVRSPDIVVLACTPALICRENLDNHEDVAA